MNITVRNISENIIEKIRMLSKIQKRSLNNEILMALERGVQEEEDNFYKANRKINKTVQMGIWKQLAGRWQDDRKTDEIIDDIYKSRTLGREYQL